MGTDGGTESNFSSMRRNGAINPLFSLCPPHRGLSLTPGPPRPPRRCDVRRGCSACGTDDLAIIAQPCGKTNRPLKDTYAEGQGLSHVGVVSRFPSAFCLCPPPPGVPRLHTASAFFAQPFHQCILSGFADGALSVSEPLHGPLSECGFQLVGKIDLQAAHFLTPG